MIKLAIINYICCWYYSMIKAVEFDPLIKASFNSIILQNLTWWQTCYFFWWPIHSAFYTTQWSPDFVCFLKSPIYECAETQGSCPEAAISILVIRCLPTIQIQNVLTVYLWSWGVRFYRLLMLINGLLLSLNNKKYYGYKWAPKH